MEKMLNPYGKTSYAYAVAVISALENTLISEAEFEKLRETNRENFLKFLNEKGYGGNVNSNSLDEIISNQLKKTYDIINEITPDKEITDLFFMSTDAHNLKVLLKAKLYKKNADDLLINLGTIPIEILKYCVANDDYSTLPEGLSEKLYGVWEIRDLKKLSQIVDEAIIFYIFSTLDKSKLSVIKKYFTAKILCLNKISKMRAEKLGRKQMWSEINLPNICEDLDIPDFDNIESIYDAEKKMSEFLISMIENDESSSFEISPIILYILRREEEAVKLRVLFNEKSLA